MLLKQSGVASAIRAIGAHGQTVRHRPGEFDASATRSAAQPGAAGRTAGIDVVADFRSRDVAAGGQGAPLVPAFHRALFAVPGETVAVLNLGGIANLTVLAAAGTTLGFDCGPANALMDHWCQQHTRPALRRRRRLGGRRPGTAAVAARRCWPNPTSRKPPPKSTGRDLFNPRWLAAQLARSPRARGAGRAGHTGRTDGAQLRRRRAALRRRGARIAGLRRRRAQRAPDAAPGGAAAGRQVRATEPAACRRRRSRRPPSPGWPARIASGEPAICPRSPAPRAARAGRALPGRLSAHAKAARRRPVQLGAAIRPRSSTRSRRWSWRSGS